MKRSYVVGREERGGGREERGGGREEDCLSLIPFFSLFFVLFCCFFWVFFVVFCCLSAPDEEVWLICIKVTAGLWV